MANEAKLSVVILSKNEAETITRCLDYIYKYLKPFEVVVVDDNSIDDTVKIAKNKGAKVLIHIKKDFAEARNFGLKNTTGEWIFYIDADELVSSELAREISVLLQKETDVAAIWVTRVNYYLGKKWPFVEKIIRLFRKNRLERWYGEVHESPIINGKIEGLSQPLIHITHRKITEMVANTNIWSDIEARLRFTVGHPPVSWWRLPRVMLPVFFDYYIRQGGWKVGTVGLIESIYQTFSIFITYAKLWELQHKNYTNLVSK